MEPLCYLQGSNLFSTGSLVESSSQFDAGQRLKGIGNMSLDMKLFITDCLKLKITVGQPISIASVSERVLQCTELRIYLN